MLNRDQFYIYTALKELGFTLLSCHARVEENIEILKGYIPIIIKECKNQCNYEISEMIINKGVISRAEFSSIFTSI